MDLFIDYHFYLKFNCCAQVYIMKFCHLKIMSGAVDAKKWSAKWSYWNISDIFFSSSTLEERKQRRRPETFAPCKMIIPSGFDQDSLNSLIHNDPRQCTRELAHVMNCDHSTIV